MYCLNTKRLHAVVGIDRKNDIYVHILLKAFKTYVLPIFEYAQCMVTIHWAYSIYDDETILWSHYHKLDIRKLERVQQKFTKRLPGCACFSYTSKSGG